MTDDAIDLDELERLHKAATPGPWGRRLGTSAVHQPLYECWIPQTEADADLIAAMRNALPALLAHARRALELEPDALFLVEHAGGSDRLAEADADRIRAICLRWWNKDPFALKEAP